MVFNLNRAGRGIIYSVAALASVALGAEITVRPVADGTLIDGGLYGAFDGTADAADWYFNESSYEGAITLVRGDPGLEQRVVWEYNLSGVTYATPVTATFTFTLRGAPRFPADAAEVHVYAYPADGLESLADFNRAPIALIAERSIEPYQVATTYVANISEVVNAAMLSGLKKVAFRLQINPAAVAQLNQAFMDAAETDQTTKPFLTIRDRVPSDFDDDRDVDLDDYAAFCSCMNGPTSRIAPACEVFDADLDGDVDLEDLPAFVRDSAAY